MRRIWVSALLLLPWAGVAAAAPADRVLESTAVVRVRDDRGAEVSLRVPLALHRGANHFRLWGPRPFTLQQHERRVHLYRDAFLELATRTPVVGRASAWDDLRKQLEWLRGVAGSAGVPPPPAVAPGELENAVRDLLARARALPGSQHLGALIKALGDLSPSIELPDTVMTSLQLRALATDAAERRLEALGRCLHPRSPGDPALSEGFRAAQTEFRSLREGLWSAIAGGLQKNRGHLLLSAVRQVLLTPLGGWAIFGFIAWKGAESAVNAEYRGQYAVSLATIAAEVAEASRRDSTLVSLALLSEYALTVQCSDALRQDGLLGLKPAGGRSPEQWQVQLASRLEELRPWVEREP